MLMNKVEIEPVSINPVPIKKVGSGFIINNVSWSYNYNGVNAFGAFQAWKPLKGRGVVSLDFYYKKVPGWSLLFDSDDITSGREQAAIYGNGHGIQVNTSSVTQAVLNGKVMAAEQLANSPVNEGFNTLELTYSTFSNSISLLGTENRKPKYCFKGQIYNFKLIDLDSSDNSKFYSGIICSYVAPETTDVAMPSSNILIDNWCKPVVYKNTFKVKDVFTISGHPAIRLTTKGDSEEVNTWLSGNYLQVGSGISVTGMEASTVNDNDFILLSTTEGISKGDIITLTKVTHGILYNFGTYKPCVPLLRDREEYCSNLTDGSFIRGVNSAWNILTGAVVSNCLPGSWNGDDELSTRFPVGSILVGGAHLAKIAQIGQHHPENVTLEGSYTESIQKAFQYPHSFKVIKPTDPDYNDYLPDE